MQTSKEIRFVLGEDAKSAIRQMIKSEVETTFFYEKMLGYFNRNHALADKVTEKVLDRLDCKLSNKVKNELEKHPFRGMIKELVFEALTGSVILTDVFERKTNETRRLVNASIEEGRLKLEENLVRLNNDISKTIEEVISNPDHQQLVHQHILAAEKLHSQAFETELKGMKRRVELLSAQLVDDIKDVQSLAQKCDLNLDTTNIRLNEVEKRLGGQNNVLIWLGGMVAMGAVIGFLWGVSSSKTSLPSPQIVKIGWD